MNERDDRAGGTDGGLAAQYRLSQEPGSTVCPSADTLTALVLGELSGGERDAISDHAVGCRRCSRDLQLLFETKRETSRAASPPRRSIWAAGLAAAAVLALAAILVPALRRPASPADETLRSLSTTDPARLASPPGGAELPRAPENLRWPALDGDSGYTIKLFDSTGRSLWESPALTAPAATLPAEVRARITRGSYFWVVTAERPTGSERRGPYSFSIVAR